MTLRVDLHLHSCLSPCGDADMTPSNLVTMAWLKGLDAIAVADHNSARNLPACAAIAEQRGILLLPAIEVTVREEVHVLCYLPGVAAALELGDWLYERLPAVRNKPDFFGEQTVMNERDEAIATEPKLLIQAAGVSLHELFEKAWAMDGIAVPAHINRGANSLLGVLGFFPPDVAFPTIEVDPAAPPPRVDVSGYRLLHNSDAHRLEAIAEEGVALDVPERSVAAVLRVLRAGWQTS